MKIWGKLQALVMGNCDQRNPDIKFVCHVELFMMLETRWEIPGNTTSIIMKQCRLIFHQIQWSHREDRIGYWTCTWSILAGICICIDKRNTGFMTERLMLVPALICCLHIGKSPWSCCIHVHVTAYTTPIRILSAISVHVTVCNTKLGQSLTILSCDPV